MSYPNAEDLVTLMDRLIVLFEPQLHRGDIEDAGHLHGSDPGHEPCKPPRLPPNSQLLLIVVGLPHGVPEELDVLAALPVFPGGRNMVPRPVVDVAGLLDVAGDLKDPGEVGGEVPAHKVLSLPVAGSEVIISGLLVINKKSYCDSEEIDFEEQSRTLV